MLTWCSWKTSFEMEPLQGRMAYSLMSKGREMHMHSRRIVSSFGHVITANRACLLLWGLEAVSWVGSRPIVSASCAQQGQGEMTLVWQWYGSVQCEKVWVQGYYWMAPNTNCTMKLTRLWYPWHSVCPRMFLWETPTCHTQHDYTSVSMLES